MGERALIKTQIDGLLTCSCGRVALGGGGAGPGESGESRRRSRQATMTSFPGYEPSPRTRKALRDPPPPCPPHPHRPPIKRHINHGGRCSDVHVRTLFRPSPALHQTMGMPACAHAFRIATYNTAHTPPAPTQYLFLAALRSMCRQSRERRSQEEKKKKEVFFSSRKA